jgi:hypothetical protein
VFNDKPIISFGARKVDEKKKVSRISPAVTLREERERRESGGGGV